jgi:hypothetical protein
VFRALKNEHGEKLPDDFARKVSIRAFNAKKSFDWDKFFLFGGLFVFLCVSAYAILATQFTFNVGAFQFLSGYSYFVVFAIAMVALLQWLDKKILKTPHAQF